MGGFLLVSVYFTIPGAFGIPLALGQASIYSAIGLTCATVILLRARTMSGGRIPWLLLGSMQLLWAMGDLIWSGYELVLHRPAPYPSIADAFYLAAYPLAMAGFILYVRRRAGKHTSGVLKDAAIIALLVGLSAWLLIVQPFIEESGLLSSWDIVGLSYPIMDVLLVAVSAALLVGPGANLVSNRFLLIGVAGVLFADGMYSFGGLSGTYHSGIWYDAAWLLGYVFFAAAACHSSADTEEQDQPLEVLGRHFRLLFGVGSATIGILILQHFRGQDISPLLLAVVGGGSLLLAVTRIGALYRQSQRQIAALIESEDALRRNEELLRKVFDSGVSGMAVGTADSRLIRVNRTFAAMLGYEPGEMEGMLFQDLTHPDEVDLGLARIKSLVEGTTEEIKFERRYKHREGNLVWASVSLVLAHDENGSDLVIAHVLDISHSKALEESLRQAQMMEALGQLAGGIAHDFNNLLSVIQNFTRFVYDDLDLADPNRQDLDEVLKAGDRGAGLVRQLLTMARRERATAEIFDVNDLMNNMSVLLRRTVAESISLSVLLSDDLPHVDMDRSQLEQILLNLAVNARDAMPGGGDLSFRTDVVELSQERADLALVEPGEYVRLRATDTGIGMSPDVRRRIFEPFFSTKETGAGKGLGLATVYGIVLGARGGIVVDSEPGRGTTFDIYLPSVGQRPKEALTPETAVRLEGENRCVLVVDDEDGVRRIVQRILASNGYRVLVASNLEEALEIAERSDLTIRAVVADVVMPNGSGLELVEQLRVQRPGLPALFMSGYSGDVLTAHGLGREDRYVGKPFKPDEILSALSAAIGYEDTLIEAK